MFVGEAVCPALIRRVDKEFGYEMSNRPQRVLFLVPKLSSAGGVSNYYKLLLPILRARSKPIQVDHLEMPIRRQCRFSFAIQLVEWLAFILNYIFYVVTQRPFLMVLSPSLTQFCLLRDSFLITLLSWLHKRCRTIVFFRGWNILNEIYLCDSKASRITSKLLCADVILSLTAQSQDTLKSLVPATTQLQKFHTIVDPELEIFLQTHSKHPKKKDSYLFLGNVAKEKGIFELLSAFREIVYQKPDAKLKILGKGAAYASVQMFIERHGLQANIEAPGTVDGEEKHRHLAEAEVFILPSYTEGMPNAVLEALAAKCIVLGTPVGAMGEFIERGLITPLKVKSTKSLHAALADIEHLRETIDTDRIAKEVVGKYGIETTLTFFLKQFTQAKI